MGVMSVETTLLDDLIEFYRTYYRDEIAELAQGYPRDKRSVYVQWSDLYQADLEAGEGLQDFADDFERLPRGGATDFNPLQDLHDALYEYDLPIDISLEGRDDWPDAHVRVLMPEHKRMGLEDIRSRHKGRYVAIRGMLDRVTEQSERVRIATFECRKCDYHLDIPQPRDEWQEPGGCPGACSGKPSWTFVEHQSSMIDMRKLRLKQPPESASGDGKAITVYVEDDLAFLGGEAHLPDMTGERVTVHGILRRDIDGPDKRGAKPEAGSFLEGHAIEFENSVAATVATDDHRDAVENLANRDDTLEYAIANFVPGITGGVRMHQVKRGAVLYLFGGFRKEADDGSGERGDVHMLVVGDPSTGKTSILDFIETISPRCERLSGTGTTGVGLTAAAQQDEFADGDWTLKPGVLPRASGGHAIIDEIDDMDVGGSLHEALESQRIHVAKAGMKATLKTEAGLIAAGNPASGRFDDWDSFRDEIDIDPALFSRFDVIHTLQDQPDEEIDGAVADAALGAWQAGEEATSDIPVDVWRAWIATAKDVEPEMSAEARETIREWFVEERNKDDGDTVRLTRRALVSAARLAEAHARMNLRDVVTARDAEIAIDVKKGVMGDVYRDGLEIDADYVTGATSQRDRIKSVENLLDEFGPMARNDLISKAKERGMDPDKVDHEIDKLKTQGKIYEPPDGGLRTA